jgi:transcriptional regulator with XRE-family HTH domain
MSDPREVSGRDETTLGARIGGRVRGLRARRGLSLDGLAARSGVSRSAISVIERGESSPTAVVLEKLAGGLDVSLASLFDDHGPADPAPVARRADQPEWKDPDSGYVRRNVSPPATGSPIRIVEVLFPPEGRVAYETVERDTRLDEQIWVLEGAIDVTAGGEHHRLGEGDCLALVVDGPVVFHNPHGVPARYAVVLADLTAVRR